jgi:hypothetical protein
MDESTDLSAFTSQPWPMFALGVAVGAAAVLGAWSLLLLW